MDIFNKLNDETLNSISILLNNGFSMKDILSIIEDDKNKSIIYSIKNKLLEGEKIEYVIIPYLNHNIAYYLLCFIQYMPFSEALSFARNIIEKRNERIKNIINILFYPIMLLVGMIFGLLILSIYLLPSINSLSSSFSNDISIIDSSVIRTICIIFLVLFLVFLIVIGILFSNKFIINTYRMIYSVNKRSILIDYYTERFVYIYYLCLNNGLSTIDSLSIISKIDERSVNSYIAKSIDSELKKGNDIIKAINNKHLSSSFIRFFNIAIKTVNPIGIINSYLEYINKYIDLKIKRYAKTIQVFVYLLIGIIVVYIYSLLLFPINILNNL